MAETTLPWIAKGILTGEDAEAAAAAGASAVLVSNHGGRQLDGAPAALGQLPEVVAAVGGQLQIGLDGGVRRGSDVVTAVALGADVVVLGRLAVYGLAAAGEHGVRWVLQLLREEIVTVLTLLGRGGISELDRAALQQARSRPARRARRTPCSWALLRGRDGDPPTSHALPLAGGEQSNDGYRLMVVFSL